MKFGMDDYVRHTTWHPKWHASRIRGVTPANGWNVKGNRIASMLTLCDQRHGRETQADYEDGREEQVSTERRRPRQTWAVVAIHRQEEPTTWKVGRDEALFRISGVYCHFKLHKTIFPSYSSHSLFLNIWKCCLFHTFTTLYINLFFPSVIFEC